MVVINLKKRFLLFLLMFLCGVNGALYSACRQNHDPNITNIVEDAYQKLGLKNGSADFESTQTLSYLRRPGLRNGLDYYNHKIDKIGHGFFKELFEMIISKEMEYKDDFYVFYHGQVREFMLIQDLYQGLYEWLYKKAFKDFVMLRVPDKDLNKFRSVVDFLRKHIKNGAIKNFYFDSNDDIKKMLLSVNPSLFGNSRSPGECTFYYFIYSNNASYFDTSSLVKNVFDYFKLKNYFDMYEDEVNEIKTLLSARESNKTGILLQIFIPKALVNDIAYRCRPWGLLYHDSVANPETYGVATDLCEYQSKNTLDDYAFDSTQFRLIMNKTMLDSQSGVKILRYCNETPNLKTYKTKLKELLNKIERKYEKSPANLFGFSQKLCEWLRL